MKSTIVNLPNKIAELKYGSLHYSEIGEGDPIILMHGFGGSRLDWSENIQTLSQNNKLFIIDLPGFGKSPPPENIKDYATFCLQTIDHFRQFLQYEKVSLMGNSMGGGISLGYTLNFPNNVEKIIVVNSNNLGKEIHFGYRLLSTPWLLKLALVFVSRFSLKLIWKEMFFNRDLVEDKRVLETYLWLRKTQSKTFLLQIFHGNISISGQTVILQHQLKNIRVPTCIVWGSEDNILPISHGLQAKKQNENFKFHSIEDCGHLPQIEKTNEFNSIVTNFLKTT